MNAAFVVRQLAHGQAHQEAAAVPAPRFQFPLLSDDPRLPALQVAPQVAVMGGGVRLRHQQADVAAEHFLLAVAEQGHDGVVDAQDAPGRIDVHHAIQHVLEDGAGARFARFQLMGALAHLRLQVVLVRLQRELGQFARRDVEMARHQPLPLPLQGADGQGEPALRVGAVAGILQRELGLLAFQHGLHAREGGAGLRLALRRSAAGGEIIDADTRLERGRGAVRGGEAAPRRVDADHHPAFVQDRDGIRHGVHHRIGQILARPQLLLRFFPLGDVAQEHEEAAAGDRPMADRHTHRPARAVLAPMFGFEEIAAVA